MKQVSRGNPVALDYEELACRERLSVSSTGGIRFVRRRAGDQKQHARNLVLELCSPTRHHKGLTLLTMPGLHWQFERQLLSLREGARFSTRQRIHRTYICGVESDHAIFRASIKFMPGLESGVALLTPPHWSQQSIRNRAIPRYHNATVEDVLRHDDYGHQVAWLDFCGPVTSKRMELIRRFWADRVQSTLIVTAQNGRWDADVSFEIDQCGGLFDWFSACLPGRVEHRIKYNDSCPMVQFAVSKESA